MNKDIEVKPEELEGKTLIVTHMSQDKFNTETVEDLGRLEEGEEVPSKKVFEDPGELAKLFTEKRKELVKEVKENQPGSISQLAENLERGKSEVYSDLKLLEKHGIVFFEEDGQAKKPRIPYDEIKVEFNLLGENSKIGDGIKA
ncbi:MAG: transcriptional regulator [Candidatus Nanohalobium sp.]